LQVSWSEEQPEGRGPTSICIRTRQTYLIEDTEESAAFVPWRKRAAAFGMRSSLAIPFVVNGGRAGALMVYAAHPKAFEPVAIDVFQHLGEEIGHGERITVHDAGDRHAKGAIPGAALVLNGAHGSRIYYGAHDQAPALETLRTTGA